jgi:hypothetical protein
MAIRTDNFINKSLEHTNVEHAMQAVICGNLRNEEPRLFTVQRAHCNPAEAPERQFRIADRSFA